MERTAIHPFGFPAEREEGVRGPHLVDTTMFWSPVGGGVGRYLRDKRRWLNAHMTWRHTLVVTGGGADAIRVRGLPLPFSGGYRFPVERSRAARQLASLAPDLIEVGDPYRLAWAALDAAQMRGIPAVAFCHSNIMEVAARSLGVRARSLAERYARHVYRSFDAVLAGSRWMATELRDLGLDNVVHQPLGVDLSTFNPAQRDDAWRRRLAIPDGTTVLIYTGRFALEKNTATLGALVDRLGAGFVLVAIGAGPNPPRGARVRTLPYQDDPAALATALASADVFVHAGEQETFGLAPLESLACGTPVVMPARAGLVDLLDGRAAIGVSRPTPEALAEAVRELLTHDRDPLQHAAVAIARAFDATRAFERLFARYSALRSGRAQASGGVIAHPYA
jgi:alpha-1,6-mannosyltransferase